MWRKRLAANQPNGNLRGCKSHQKNYIARHVADSADSNPAYELAATMGVTTEAVAATIVDRSTSPKFSVLFLGARV
jgi:hypothetical protein